MEYGPELGGIGSVIQLATAKQVYKEVDHFTLWLVGVLVSWRLVNADIFPVKRR